MMPSVSPSDTFAAWPSSARWLEGVARAIAAVVRKVARGADSGALHVSRQWLDEFERRSAKHGEDR